MCHLRNIALECATEKCDRRTTDKVIPKCCYASQATQKPNRKTRSESRDIDENDIIQWLYETFGIFCKLAAEWRPIVFVYDVIGNMAIATSVDARGNRAMIRDRWQFSKAGVNGNSARCTSTQRHIRLPICDGGSDNFSLGISRK